MNPDYEYIELVFENCNTVKIPPKYIHYLDISDITERHWMNVVGQYTKQSIAKYVEIVLDTDAINLLTHFQIAYPNAEHSESSSFKNHLDVYKDITNIYIKLNDKDEFGIAVPWKDDGSDKFSPSNLLQKIKENYPSNEFTIIIKE
jgi:hypothetical protein